MLLIYLLDGEPDYIRRTEQVLSRSKRRGDVLFTSYPALGELMAGAEKSKDVSKAKVIRDAVQELGFSFLPFDGAAVATFSRLRARERIKAPDAIHLACAAAAGIDLFLTGDKQLTRLDVPGIHFIVDFNAPVF
jgi:predicted nucleic acid-binding protein